MLPTLHLPRGGMGVVYPHAPGQSISEGVCKSKHSAPQNRYAVSASPFTQSIGLGPEKGWIIQSILEKGPFEKALFLKM